MKKILTVLLVVVAMCAVLIGVAAATADSPKIEAYNVSLGDDIAIRFYATNLEANNSYTATFEKNGVAVSGSVTVQANDNGDATFVFDKLTPADITAKIKISFEADGTTVTNEHSVLDYCAYQLSNLSESNTLWTLIVDLLNYGAAAQEFIKDTNAVANGELNALQQALATQSFVAPTETVHTETIENPTVCWTQYTMALGKSVKYRYFFTVEEGISVDGVTFVFSNGTKVWQISGSSATLKDGVYCLDFTSLNPADLYTDITVCAKDQDGNVLSNTVTFSAARYAKTIGAVEGSTLDKLLDSILTYATGAAAYVEDPKAGIYNGSTRDFTAGDLTAYENYRLSLASENIIDIPLYGNSLINAIYQRAGISADAFVWQLSRNPQETLFPEGVLTSDTGSSLYKMLISGSYGGTKITDTNGGWLTESQYKVGDLLNWYDGETHYAGIYQGEGNFAVVNQDANVESVNKTISEIAEAKDTYNWYFALRPTEMIITRGDMEAALKEVLWAYYAKDVWAQYESTTFNAISYTHGGFTPLGNHLNTLEDATSQNTLYSVCSNYAWSAYYEALGYPMFGYCLNAGSYYAWVHADSSVADEEVDDMCVMRWHNYPCDYYDNTGDEDGNNLAYIDHEHCLGTNGFEETTFQAMLDFFWNYEDNLRPGDIIRLPGHIVVYAGDGWILEAGGGKYDKTYGYDSVEADGVINATHILDYFFPNGRNDDEGSEATSFRLWKYKKDGTYGRDDVDSRNYAGICVLRPLDLLTTDDGDSKASENDLLNLNYYNNGVDRLPWQLEQDVTELAHTGYTVQDTTYTRLLYPMMNINRTVNIGAYGTAVQGSTITYTIEIINESNNEKFVETRGNGYAGETYMSVPVVETIPANVEFVEASNNGVLGSDGKLYWAVDVPAGESVSVTYTVKVTGNIGDEIVCGGGFVGAIPSNTIVNTIGGEKLSNKALQRLLDFYDAGTELWNSNDAGGYKISASKTQDGSVFAEQLYRVAGLELDLPKLEDLLEMLFSREYVSISQGTFVGHAKSASSWMFTLNNQTADPADQVWRDMVINDSFFGGTYVWTNNFDPETRRVGIPRVDNLEAGDFIINMNVRNGASATDTAYDITDWKIIFYLGDNKFATLTDDGVLTACEGPREILTGIVYDVFIGMRPSQKYANVNTDLEAYTGTPATLNDFDMAWAPADPSNITLALNIAEQIAAMKLTDKKYIDGNKVTNGVPMIGEVYMLAGIDVNTNGFANMNYRNLTHVLFNDIPSDSEVYKKFGHEYHLLNQAVYGYESLYNMLMFYNGPAFADVQKDGTMNKPITDIELLEIGDVIVLGRVVGNTQRVMIFQGMVDGEYQFICSTVSPIGGNYLGEWKELIRVADTSALMEYIGGDIIVTEGTSSKQPNAHTKDWEGYIILRPARGFTNINERMPRDLADRPLNETEEQILAGLAEAELDSGNDTYNTFIKWAYGQAMIDVDDRFALLRDGAIANNMYFYNIWKYSNNVIFWAEDLETRILYKMLVPNSWHGSYFATNPEVGEYTLRFADYRIGDVVIARYTSGAYYAAIYQGGNQFLVMRGGMVEVATYDTEEEICGGYNWQYFFVLRPQKLSPTYVNRDLADKQLTAYEKAVLAALTADYDQIGGNQLSHLANWAYGYVDIGVSSYFAEDLDVSDVYEDLFSNDKLKSGNTSAWYKMLMPGSYDGYRIDRTGEDGTDTAGVGTAVQLKIWEYKIGDIFCGMDSEDTYWSALYQGSGQFLVLKSTGTAKIMTLDDVTTIADNTWAYYFVLRPDNLATSGIVIDKVQLPPIAA